MSAPSLPIHNDRMLRHLTRHHRQGFSLIEVLVTLVVVALGLLGLTALQAKLQLSEIDAYQRAQALLLAQDMADRLATNRDNASAYSTTSALGTGDHPAANCAAEATIALRDRCEWSTALQGAAETEGTILTGAMVGARGCVEAIGNDSYLITVAWQGLTPLSAPSVGVSCGAGLYGASGSPCQNDLCRRAITTIVRIGTMD